MGKPTIRFEGYTDDWEQRKLSEISDVRDGTHDSPSYLSDGHPFVTSKNVKDGYINYDDVQYISDEDFEAINKRSKVDMNDILMGMIGTIGNLALIRTEPDFAIKNVALIKDTKQVSYMYLYHYLQSSSAERQLLSGLDGGTQKFVSLKNIRELNIMVPSEAEQLKVGNFIESLDHLITLHHRKCEETKKLKKFMLQKMFPKKGEKVPDIRFDGFTDDWEQRKFSDVVDIGNGMDYKHLEEGNIPVYGTGGYMLSVNKALSDDKDAIGIGRKGTIDKPYILRAPFWTVDTLFYCIPKENYDLDFTSCIFQNVDWKKKDESTGVPSLSKVIINNVETAIPTFDEQKKIGNYFRSLDHLITLHQHKCEELQNIKKFMLQNMFT